MRATLVVLRAAGLLSLIEPVAHAQTLGEVFRQVAPAVVAIRAKGREAGAGRVLEVTARVP